MDINKIVVGVDFSPQSDAALAQAVHLARHLGAQIVLVHAGTVPDELPPAATAAVRDYRERLTRQLDANRQALAELRERYDGTGVDVSHMVIDAFPDTGLCRAARELDADLVVTGSHGRTGVERFLLGSVAERVVRLSERNVMVARTPKTGDDGHGGFRRILVPTDFTPLDEAALALALRLVARDGAIELLHCWELVPLAVGASPEAVTPVSDRMRDAIANEVAAQGQRLVDTYRRDRVTLSFRADYNTPTAGILHRLDEDAFDLVVLGSHSRRGLRRFLLGSVAEMTVRHAPCSVLVVHAGPASAAGADAAKPG